MEEIQSSVRDVRIQLKKISLLAYVAFNLYGKEMSLELEGRLAVRDGFLQFIPTAGKLGSLPLPGGTLQTAAQQLFDSPERLKAECRLLGAADCFSSPLLLGDDRQVPRAQG